MKTYSLDFKLNAIELSNETGSRATVAQELNISVQTIKYWRYCYNKDGLKEHPPRIKKIDSWIISNLRRKLKVAEKECKKLERKVREIESEKEIFKMARRHLFLKPRDKYQFIHENKETFSILKICRVLEIPPLGYFHWRNRPPTKQAIYNQVLVEEIKKIYEENKGRYGSRRITKELHVMGFKTCQPAVCKLMRLAGLNVALKKKFRVTTDSSHRYPVTTNKLKQNFLVSRPNEVWVSDLTYIRIGYDGWLYLTTVIDLFDRKVIGWSLSQSLRAIGTSVEAFKIALNNRPLQEDQSLIFHSDRGIQYACQDFTLEIKKYSSITQSMNRKKTFWDNAVAESFFSRLKMELVYRNKYETREQAEESVFDYIENYYNTNRRHSHLNNLTITEFQKLVDDGIKDNITR